MIQTGRTLEGRLIVLGVTGSIAAVETIKLVHALRRQGAVVQGVMSDAAAGIIHPDALTYATGRPVLTRCSGMVEHVQYCGIEGEADLLLIAPCTANTLGKMAAGIDDTSVTTFATTAIGRGMPVLVVPAMHSSMYRHPAIQDGIKRLKSWGIAFTEPKIEEQKAKFPGVDEIVLRVERAVSGTPLAGKHVLVTSGACREPVDDVRVFTTRSSGRMGRELALQAFRLGAEVTIVHNGHVPCVTNVHASTAREMREQVHALFADRHFDYYLSAAAISDFAPHRKEGKIPSGNAISVELDPLPKLIDEVLEKYRPTTVAFKLGWEEGAGAQAMIDKGASLVVVNTPDAMGAKEGSFELLTREGSHPVTGTKEEVAAAIWSALR